MTQQRSNVAQLGEVDFMVRGLYYPLRRYNPSLIQRFKLRTLKLQTYSWCLLLERSRLISFYFTLESVNPTLVMSHSDQFAQTGLATPNASPVDSSADHHPNLLGEGADLERLIPQNLSNNKRAVIERLIVLYKLDSHRF